MKSITFGTKREKTRPPYRIQEPEPETQDGNGTKNGSNRSQRCFVPAATGQAPRKWMNARRGEWLILPASWRNVFQATDD